MKFSKTMDITGIPNNVQIFIGKIFKIKIKYNKKKKRYSKLTISVYDFEKTAKGATEYVIKKPRSEIISLLLLCVETKLNPNQEKYLIIHSDSRPCFLMLDDANRIIAVADTKASSSWIFIEEHLPKFIPVSNDIYQKYQKVIFRQSYSKFYYEKQILINNWFTNLISNHSDIPYINTIENTITDKFYNPFIDSTGKVWSEPFSFSESDILSKVNLLEILETIEFLGFEVRELKNNKYRISHPNLQWLK